MIPAIGLLARHHHRPAPRSRPCRCGCSPTCRSPSSPRSTRSSAAVRADPRRHLRRQGLRRLVPVQRHRGGVHRLPRRQARRRRPALDRCRRRARRAHLLQRRRDPPPPLRRMTETPREPDEPAQHPTPAAAMASSPSCPTALRPRDGDDERRHRASGAERRRRRSTAPSGPGTACCAAGSPRATRANVLAMVLAGALGFAIIAQVHQTSLEGLENLREDELVRIFAGVDQDGERLADEIRGLQTSARAAQEPVDQRGRGATRRPGAAGGARHPRRHRRRPPAPASS